MSGMNKWKITGIGLLVVVAALLAAGGLLLRDHLDMREKLIVKEKMEWYRLSRMSELVDYHVTADGEENIRVLLHANQICHDVMLYQAGTGELGTTMRNWLALYYDPLLQHIHSEAVVNKQEGFDLLRAMNDELHAMAGDVIEDDGKMVGRLLDARSAEYTALEARTREAHDRYKEEVDSYFRRENAN